ncbi:hypothetical protein ACQPUZ_15700 [Clostridium tertium]
MTENEVFKLKNIALPIMISGTIADKLREAMHSVFLYYAIKNGLVKNY